MGNFCGFGLLAWFWKAKPKPQPSALEEIRKTKIGAKAMPLTKDNNEVNGYQGNNEEKRQTRLEELKASNNKCNDVNIGFEKNFVCEMVGRKVVLEDIFISEREVSIVIAISSDEHRPEVTIRYTTDSWKTEFEEEATPFNPDENNNMAITRFFFMVSVPPDKSLEFVVKCTRSSGTFWDNNSNINYRVDGIREKEGPARLLAQFTPLKLVMLSELVKMKGVVLKNASLKDGAVTLTIATKERPVHNPVVHYTFDDWRSFKDASSAVCKGTEPGLHISKIQLDIPRQAKMKFAICWRHEDGELWDNNDGRNFEIQG